MDKVFNLEIDGQITLPDGRKLGPLYETTVKVVQPSGGGYDELSDGNITEIDGKKYLTPLGGGIIREPLNIEFTVTATEDDDITLGYPIAEGNLIVGETYRVTVNGVNNNYICSMIESLGIPMIGTDPEEFTGAGDWVIISQDNKTYPAVLGNVGDEFSFGIEGQIETICGINDKFLPEPDSAYVKAPFKLVNSVDGYRLLDNNNNVVTNSQFIEYREQNNGFVSIYFDGGIFQHSASDRSNNVVRIYDTVTSGVVAKHIEITYIEINTYDADPNSPVVPFVRKYRNDNIAFSQV